METLQKCPWTALSKHVKAQHPEKIMSGTIKYSKYKLKGFLRALASNNIDNMTVARKMAIKPEITTHRDHMTTKS